MDPDVTINSGNQLTFNNAFNLVNINGAPVQTTQASSSNTMDPLTSWIFGNNGLSFNRYRVYHGNQQLPDDFLDGTANIYSEFSHHFGLKYVGIPNIPSGNSSQYTDSDDPDILVKGIRFQLSLNTCQGCHSGETKTNFTMMIPRGYGESANYWATIPDYVTYSTRHTTDQTETKLDPRFAQSGNGSHTVVNNGTTYEHYDHIPVDNMNFTQKLDNTTNQIVAPFITGRLYSSATGNHWEDDELNNLTKDGGVVNDPFVDEADDDLGGKYWVNDPSNEYSTSVLNTLGNGKGGKYPQLHDKLHGFNDLQLRKEFLCEFLHFGCSGDGGLLAHLAQLQRIPLPPHSH